MLLNLNVSDKEGKKTTHNAPDDQKRPIDTTKGAQNTPSANDLSEPNPKDPTLSRKRPKLDRVRWRETWMPVLNLVIAFLALVVIVFQASIYNEQRKIMNKQSEFMDAQTQIMQKSFGLSETTLHVKDRAYVNVANLTAKMDAGEILMMLENTGNIPAIAIKLEANVYRVTPTSTEVGAQPNTTSANEKMEGSFIQWDAGTVPLFPGSFRMYVPITMQNFTPEEMNAVLARKEILYVAGSIRYEDRFGNADSTPFAFEYKPPPNESWTVHSDLSKVFGKKNN